MSFQDDLNRLSEYNRQLNASRAQQEAAQQAAYQQQQAQQQKQQQNQGGLIGFLGSIAGGIGDTIGSIGKGIAGVLGTGVASAKDLFSGNNGGNITYTKDMMEKYAANNKDNKEWMEQYQPVLEKLKNQDKISGVWLEDSNGKPMFVESKEGKETTAFKRSLYGNADDDKIDYNKIGWDSVKSAADVASLAAPMATAGMGTGARIATDLALDTGLGAVQGAAQAGANGGNWEDIGKGALIGSASGLASSGVGNLANVKLGAGNHRILNSAPVRGALSGAVGGAVGGGTGAALYGGDVGSAIGEGLGQGAMQGATAATLMSGINKVGNKIYDKRMDKLAQSDNGFGKRYNTMEGNPDQAIDYLLKRKGGEVEGAIKSPAVEAITGDGNVDLVYGKGGDDGYGLAHIVEKHGLSVAKKVPDIIQNGEVYQPTGVNDRLYVQKPGDKSVVRLDWDGNKKQWVATAFEDNPASKGVRLANTSSVGTSPDNATSDTPITSNIPQDTNNVNRGTLTQKQSENLQRRNQALLDQYGIVDAPTSRSTKPLVTVGEIADAGFEKPKDVRKIIGRVTGSDGKVNKLNRKVIASAQPVNTFDGVEPNQTFENFVDNQIQLAGLDGDPKGKAVKSAIMARMNSLSSRRNGSISFTDDPDEVFGVIQNLGKKRADYLGKGETYHRPTSEDAAAASVIRSVEQLLEDRIYDSSDVSKVVTPEVISEMKEWYPENQKWASWVDNNIATAKSGRDLRAAQAPFVRMGRILENNDAVSGTWGARNDRKLSDFGKFVAGTNTIGKVLYGLDMAKDTNLGRGLKARIASRRYDKSLSSPNIVDGQIVRNTTSPSANSGLKNTNITVQNGLLDVLGRTQGIREGQQAAQQAQANNLEQQLADTAYATDDTGYVGAPDAGTGYGSVGASSGTYSSGYSSGNNMLDRIANGMENALNAGDIAAFSELADIYNTLSKVYGNSGDGGNAAKTSADLNATQQANLAKLDSAETAINELETLYNNAGGGQGIIGGNLTNFAGSMGWNSNAKTYNDMAQGLINQIMAAVGKTDALNNEGEVDRALDLIPKITDDNQTAQNKLAALRRLLAENRNIYQTTYGINQY